jgi:IS30 family transposase
MEHGKSTGHGRKGKHLTMGERIVIERMLGAGYPAPSIAATLDRHRRTIEREIARGRVAHRGSEWCTKIVYNADRGQDVHALNATAKGPKLKLRSNQELVDFVSRHIRENKESPAVVAFKLKSSGIDGVVCTNTLYSYIDQGLIAGVSNESLWEKRKRSGRTRKVVRRSKKAHTRRKSIEQRPAVVESRSEFGHWEIDLVVGSIGCKAALMTLVERQTRKLIIRKLPDKKHSSVRRALNGIEREYGAAAFRKTFKTITADNGSEFLDVDGMQRSVLCNTARTRLFYAHPYSSWERGSNENTNRIIRRFIPKGSNIANFSRRQIKETEEWINNYPRKIIDFQSPQQLFQEIVGNIAA